MSYANVQHVFLLASKPEHPLFVSSRKEWRVLRTSVGAVSSGNGPVSTDLLQFTHFVEPVEPCPKPYPSCGRCHGAGVLGGWQGTCPQCGGAV